MVTEPSNTGESRFDKRLAAPWTQRESGSGAEDVTECCCFLFFFYFVTYLQDLIDGDLPKAVQLFRSLTEQVGTS